MVRSLLFLFGVGLGASVLPASSTEIPSPARAGTYTLTLKSGGYEREAFVHLPKGYDPAKPPALVVGLHGAGGNGQQFLESNHWVELADKKGVIVVCPTGLPARPEQKSNFLTNPVVWNSGQLREGSARAKIDDVAYARELLDALQKKAPYNAKRVFLTGHSNGASMSFKLAEKLSTRFAGLSTVAGMVANPEPKMQKPVPTLYLIGTEDPLLPPAGGESKLLWGTRYTLPVADYLMRWAKANACETKGEIVSDKNGLKTVEYRPKAGGAKLTAIYVEGHGHAWPGGKTRGVRESTIGPIKQTLDATQRMWEFFESLPSRG